MKTIFSTVVMLLIFVSVSGKEKLFVGSTPANNVVRSFLQISLTDSVDFIRWNLILTNSSYKIECNYGISKANTNGFINGGKTVELSGESRLEKNYYHLINGNRTLKILLINEVLLHLLNTNNTFLVGNGGWSYTLNSTEPLHDEQVSILSAPIVLQDSVIFEGRTPCGVPNVIPEGTLCYKIKWLIVFYSKANKPYSYKIMSTGWRKAGGLKGTWKFIEDDKGHIYYQLNDDTGKAFIHLLQLDGQVLMFTDAQQKLLVGNHDFSYTLNKR